MSLIHSRRRAGAATLALAAAVLSGCGAQRQTAAGGAVSVSERDFHIAAPATVRAGEVTLRVHNWGPDRHELIVARVGSGGAAALPLRTDGLTLDEEHLQKSEVGELEPGAPGSVRTLHLNLPPGRYVFFCNMAGHFLGGMHADVVVQ